MILLLWQKIWVFITNTKLHEYNIKFITGLLLLAAFPKLSGEPEWSGTFLETSSCVHICLYNLVVLNNELCSLWPVTFHLPVQSFFTHYSSTNPPPTHFAALLIFGLKFIENGEKLGCLLLVHYMIWKIIHCFKCVKYWYMYRYNVAPIEKR